MSGTDSGGPLDGSVSISDAIAALRDELMRAVWAGQFPYELNGQSRTLRFKPSPVEVTLQVAATSKGTASGGVKWWLVNASTELARERVATQTVKLTLEPVMCDENGRQVELLIDTDDDMNESRIEELGSREKELDARD